MAIFNLVSSTELSTATAAVDKKISDLAARIAALEKVPPPVTPPPPATKFRFGFSFPEAIWGGDLDKPYAKMREVGATAVRVGEEWPWSEPSKGRYDTNVLANLDRAVSKAVTAGLEPLLILGCHRPPYTVTVTDWESHVDTIVKRYAALGCREFEVWNEHNNAQFWGIVTPYTPVYPNPPEYVSWLKAAYQIVKRVNPAALVFSGGYQSVGGVLGGPTVDPLLYDKELQRLGGGPYRDGIANHPYAIDGNWKPVSPGPTQTWWVRDQQLHANAVATGEGGKPHRHTEFGFSTAETTETLQAQWLDLQLAQLRDCGYASTAYIYSLHDNANNPTDKESNFGIFRWDWSEKPAVAVVKKYA